MADPVVQENGTKAKVNPTQGKVKKPRNLPSLNQTTAISNMKTATFGGMVDTSPIDWHMLENNTAFSTAEDGSFPMVKVHRSKAVSLADGKSYPVGGGRCYRVFITSSFPADK
jgi:hypothetical protein